MFAARYFAPRYFAPRYWPKVGAAGAPPFTGVVSAVFVFQVRSSNDLRFQVTSSEDYNFQVRKSTDFTFPG